MPPARQNIYVCSVWCFAKIIKWICQYRLYYSQQILILFLWRKSVFLAKTINASHAYCTTHNHCVEQSFQSLHSAYMDWTVNIRQRNWELINGLDLKCKYSLRVFYFTTLQIKMFILVNAKKWHGGMERMEVYLCDKN